MRIIIEERVDQAIDAFYDASILRHWHTLSYETVESKKNRLYAADAAPSQNPSPSASPLRARALKAKHNDEATPHGLP